MSSSLSASSRTSTSKDFTQLAKSRPSAFLLNMSSSLPGVPITMLALRVKYLTLYWTKSDFQSNCQNQSPLTHWSWTFLHLQWGCFHQLKESAWNIWKETQDQVSARNINVLLYSHETDLNWGNSSRNWPTTSLIWSASSRVGVMIKAPTWKEARVMTINRGVSGSKQPFNNFIMAWVIVDPELVPGTLGKSSQDPMQKYSHLGAIWHRSTNKLAFLS